MAVDSVFESFDFPDIYNGRLPYRFVYPAEAFKTYLEIYILLFDPKAQPVPAKDVFTVKTDDGQIGYLSRSSFWSAVFDGVSATKNNYYLLERGNVLNVGGVQPCFRNEVKEIEPGWRELGFLQADIELVGLTTETRTPQWFDKTAVKQLITSLESINIPRPFIQIRLNNFFQILYEVLGDKIGFLEKEIFGLDSLDKMATARVNKNREEFSQLQKLAFSQLDLWLSENKLSKEAESFLSTLVTSGVYDEQILKTSFPNSYQSLQNLKEIVEEIQKEYPELTVFIDPLSVRAGTPGYDGMTMQADVKTLTKIFTELAGGGAYQRAAQQSWKVQFQENPPENLYMIGFALGLTRLNTALNYLSQQ